MDDDEYEAVDVSEAESLHWTDLPVVLAFFAANLFCTFERTAQAVGLIFAQHGQVARSRRDFKRDAQAQIASWTRGDSDGSG